MAAARAHSDAGPERAVDPGPVARNRDFRVLLATQAASSLGDAVSFTAMPLLVLALTGSGLAMGIVAALQLLPDLFVGMIAGAIADRTDPKRMMFVADLGRAALTGLIPLSAMIGGPTMVVILVVAVPLSVLRSFFMAGYTAAVPALVGRSQVARANSLLEAVYSMGYIAGPAIAGVLSSAIGPGPTLAIDALSFALSGVGLMLIRRDLRPAEKAQRRHLVTEIREGIDFVLGHPILRSAILYWGVTAIISGPFVTALTVHVTRDLALSAAILGVILAGYGVGTVAGALAMGRLANRGSAAPWLIGGNILLAAALLAVASAAIVPVLVGAALVAGIAQSIVLVTYLTMRTAYSPDTLIGRIGSTARTLSFGLQPVGLVAGGAIIELTSGSTAIAIMGVGLIAVSIPFMASSALRRARTRPRRREVDASATEAMAASGADPRPEVTPEPPTPAPAPPTVRAEPPTSGREGPS
jgi:MFS family permease